MGAERTYKVAICFLTIVCLALLVALVVVAVQKDDDDKNTEAVRDCPFYKAAAHSTTTVTDIFRDLSKDELITVRDYVLKEPSLNITEYSKATERANYIFLIELMNPDKDEALSYLDGLSQKKPKRQARVVIFSGARTPPIIEEILVPVHNPTSHVRLIYGRKNPIPFSDRPWGEITYGAIQKLVGEFTLNISFIMKENFQMDCTKPCAFATPSGPPTQGRHSFWVRLHRLRLGMSIHPLPIDLRIAANELDVSFWNISEVVYNGDHFDSIENFTSAYKSGDVTNVFQPAGDDTYGDLGRRGNIEPSLPKVEPTFYEPGGKRYTSENNHIEYMGWDFDFRMRSSTGLQLFNIEFNKTRIVYELSVQEMTAFYGGYTPTSMFSRYLDSAWGLGKRFELAKGIDCPETATYYDVIGLVDAGEVTKRRNAICVFELNKGAPLRRHYEYYGENEYMYGGMVDTVLVIRSIMTPYNYDYLFDHIFYQNGVIETKVSSMGYIMGVFWSQKEQRYATRVQKHLAGPIHDHVFHYKVDLDVAGRKNSFELIKSKVEKTTRWSQGSEYHYAKYYEREQKRSEQEAKYNYNFQSPSYLNFYNEKSLNAFGVRRGYRLLLDGIIYQLYPSNWSYTKAISWSHNQVAVTKYKASEARSSSMYNQMNFYNPMVDFSEFTNDNDDISNEDLVAWVTVGVMHLPHSEDIPITSTTGNKAGFYLLPYNYFDEDPSTASRDNVLVTRGVVTQSERDARSSCTPRHEPFSFYGKMEKLG